MMTVKVDVPGAAMGDAARCRPSSILFRPKRSKPEKNSCRYFEAASLPIFTELVNFGSLQSIAKPYLAG